MDQIRVLIVDDQTVLREGLEALLSFAPDIAVIGQGQDGLEAVSMAERLQPDVILLDLVMPRLDGLAAIPEITDIAPNSHILVLTSFAESDKVFQAIKAGALGYLLKDTGREQLFQAIREVAEGRGFLHPSIAVKMIREMDQPSGQSSVNEPLTARERETLELIALGLSNQEIADKMVVNERTVAKYVSSILNKLHLANRTQAALFAVREKMKVQ